MRERLRLILRIARAVRIVYFEVAELQRRLVAIIYENLERRLPTPAPAMLFREVSPF